MPPMALDTVMKSPLFCTRSEENEKDTITIAETTYGGTVNNCARALAEKGTIREIRFWNTLFQKKDVLNPKVAMIVGKKAPMEARAQFNPKYMEPAT